MGQGAWNVHCWKARASEGDATAGLGEAQVRIHAGNHHARVDGDDLDAHQRQADEDVDDQPAIEDQLDDVVETPDAPPMAGDAFSADD